MDDFDRISDNDATAYDDMEIDLQRGSGVIPEGIHRFVIVDAIVREGPSGDPYINLTLDVDGGEFEGQRVWSTVSLGQKSRWKMDEFLDAIGADTEGRIKVSDIIRRCKGVRVLGLIAHQTYEGKTRPSIKTLMPVGDGRPVVSGAVQQPLGGLSSITAARRERKQKTESAGLPDDVVED
jgi:hypothetical protein